MRPIVLYSVVAGGVLAVSTSAALIRLADAPALAIATYRVGLAGLITAPLAVTLDYKGLRSMTRTELLWCLASSVSLAIHFTAWGSSLSHTSVASSVVLVSTSPLLVAAVSHLAYRERLSQTEVVGIGMGVVGGVVLTEGDLITGGELLYGDLLALAGAAAAGSYFLIGRKVRRTVSNISYTAIVYLGSAIVLVLTVALTGTQFTGFTEVTCSMIILVTLVPQLLGHSSLNWALGHLSATLVAIAVMAEPVGAVMLAWVILEETPPMTGVIGGALVVTGVYFAFRRPGADLAEP